MRAGTAVVAGIVIGLIYVLSPMSVLFPVVASLLLIWAGKGLPANERRAVLTLVGAAIVLRVLAVAVLFVTADHQAHQFVAFPFEGDGLYMKRRSLLTLNMMLGVPIEFWHVTTVFATYGWTGFVYVLAYLQYLIGPAPYGVHLFNTAVFLAGAILLHRLVRQSYGPLPAMVGLALLLFLPSLFFWSISALKEASQFLLGALVLWSVIGVVRGRTLLRRALSTLALVVSLVSLGTMREGALIAGAAGVVAGLLMTPLLKKPGLIVPALVAATVVGAVLAREPRVQDAVREQIRNATITHVGHVRTTGHGYKLLDQRFYSMVRIEPLTPEESVRFVGRALVSFIVVPLPWQVESRSELAFLPQMLIWYSIVLLLPFGLRAGLRRDPLLTSMIVGYVLTNAVAIAITSGNVGTLVRHRDITTPFLIWVSALGLLDLLFHFAGRRERSKSDQPGVPLFQGGRPSEVQL